MKVWIRWHHDGIIGYIDAITPDGEIYYRQKYSLIFSNPEKAYERLYQYLFQKNVTIDMSLEHRD